MFLPRWLDTCTTWIDRIRTSHRVQIFVTAVFSGALVGVTIFTYQSDRRRRLLALIKAQIPPAEQDPIAEKVRLEFQIGRAAF